MKALVLLNMYFPLCVCIALVELGVELGKYSRKLVPSLATSCENMAPNSERIIGKSRNFQIIYAHDPVKTNLSKLGVPQPPHLSHWGQVSSRKQSACGRHGLSNIEELQATFLYSIYHQRAGQTNLFHMCGGRFHAGNT